MDTDLVTRYGPFRKISFFIAGDLPTAGLIDDLTGAYILASPTCPLSMCAARLMKYRDRSKGDG